MKKNKPISLIIALALLMLTGVGSSTAIAKEPFEYLDISNPFLRKIPLAVPFFKPLNDNPETGQDCRLAAQLLSETLEFTGYFKLMDRGAFLINPLQPNLKRDRIIFGNWSGIGAELLITGGLKHNGDIVEMELRLFDTVKETLLVGKRYRSQAADQRRIIRRFCSEVLYQITGSYGMFASRIAFVSRAKGNKEIYTCDFDGFNPQAFTASGSITLSPAWSSDGKWMAYTSYRRGKPDLYIRHRLEKRGAIVAKKGINITPAWMPGAFQLAATLSFSGDQEIYLLTGTGKIIKRLTHKWGSDVSPTFSPDGKKIAFVSDRSGSPQIYIKDLDTGHVNRLTFQGRYNTQPSWSPKGDRIAYTAMEDGQHNITTIDIAGNEPIQLTRDAGDNESPSWSPDGSLIVFGSNREGISRIYMMTSFGTDQRRLLAMPGEQSNPSWSPNAIAQ